ncbi:alpha/beta fold hydrolase [Pseudonocardia sp. MH-G8]|uniref:alpha/beta fold hydrolase n=1 Tax=Pseudonocardia sp. MH-G8 TaxID=1854588 RepID=UPI000BA061A7|nr:alpha/beta fold hydrolase [Pseudonocardia sp. MH-G8]OZM75384.1 alpha/beta hydrolase [Pseudonocardia sp. MH-G8]
MFRPSQASALIALCCTVGGAVLVGCDDAPQADALSATARPTDGDPFSGTTTIDVGSGSVHVSCSGGPALGEPVIVLMAGAGDPLEKLAGIQQTLSEDHQVCAYDRLGEGASDAPDGPQDVASSGEVLTGVLDEVAGNSPVVLVGHSLGGLIAARYAPDHPGEVAGLVLLDATPPHAITDTMNLIPESATGPAAEIRGQMIAVGDGQNPEKLEVTDGDVRSAGDIPVEVIQHGPHFLTAIPDYGQDLERIWTKGQNEWLAVSSRSTLSVATESSHHIYLDQPDVAVQAVQRVVSQVEEDAG